MTPTLVGASLFLLLFAALLSPSVLVVGADVALPAECAQTPLPRILYAQRHRVLGAPPPKVIPDFLHAYYTRCGSIPTAEMYIDDSWSGKGSHYRFARQDVERFLKRAHQLHARPGSTAAKLLPFVQALQSIPALLSNGTVLVVGSQEPWYESLALAWGAQHVVTMEYNNLTYAHPQLSTVTPAQFLSSEGGGEYFGPRTFDVVVAVAAVDHDGLGRYGDPLAPDGDLLTMDWMRTLLRPREERPDDQAAVLILTAPIGPDLVVWNLERRYGRLRLPLLLEGWSTLGRFGYSEEKLTQEANFRQRFEPAWVLSPHSEAASHDEL